MAIINPGNCLPKKIDENVVCVGVANLGTVETNWGPKLQIEFVFESEKTRDNGYRINRRQRCNVNFHEKATLPQFLETWVERKLEPHEKCLDFALRQAGRQAALTLKPAQVGDKIYWTSPPCARATAIQLFRPVSIGPANSGTNTVVRRRHQYEHEHPRSCRRDCRRGDVAFS